MSYEHDQYLNIFDLISTGTVIFLIGTVFYIQTNNIIPIMLGIIGIGLILFSRYYKDPSSDNISKSEKDHYNTLISLYKYTGGIIVLLVGIAAWIIGGNINEIKKNSSNELDNLKRKLSEIKNDADSAIKQSQLDTDKQVEQIRNNMKLFLDLTKDVTSMQIETIREDAKNLALSSARTRIEEVFSSNNLQNEIERTARNEIGEKLEGIVQSEFQRSSKLFEELPIITGLLDNLNPLLMLSDDED